ncbi:MAG TPA: beta-propeller domain-containing protein [Allosphingosinicella sp.]|nr:beta-propeller domain-containing protein [Allosphingosinicella sp.]
MSRLLLSGILGLAAIAGLGVALRPGEAQTQPAVERPTEGPRLTRFASDAEFARYLATVARRRRVGVSEADGALSAGAPPGGIVNFEAAADAAPANPEITNNQTIGVDEGGIVKQIGRFLVVLQDGRLFSADLGTAPGAPLRLADRIDVYRSRARAASWYDEMLVFGDRIMVTAYNYRERASEITVIRMAPDGRLTREGRFLLSSDDYYSTENYATRIVGGNLVFYAPQSLGGRGPDGGFAWPRLRRADGDGEAGEGEALIGPTDVIAPVGNIDDPVLHTLSICPLRGAMDCRTTAFIGPAMRELFVSPTDAFLWIGAPDGLPWSIDYANRRRQDCAAGHYWQDGRAQAAMLYRLPLDGAPVGAVAVDGIPSDQFAFESSDGRFRALLSRAGAGCFKPDQMRALNLLDIPLSAFGERVRQIPDRAYAPLPPVAGQLENRFVGPWLVYGSRSGWTDNPVMAGGTSRGSTLIAVPLARPGDARRLALPHNALRIERAGNDAVVTGYRGQSGLSLSYVGLGRDPRIAATTLLADRFESEGRSHAFNAWIRPDGSGLIGLPTTLRRARSGRGWSDSQSSELSFVAVSPDKTLSPAGQLSPQRRTRSDYRCEVSCVDWYGNSRPIFTGGRILALMGTDLVEGRLAGGQMGEIGRLDLTGAHGGSGAGRGK